MKIYVTPNIKNVSVRYSNLLLKSSFKQNKALNKGFYDIDYKIINIKIVDMVY